MSTRYEEVLASPEWRAKADLLKDWVNWSCELCGLECELQVHHIHYRTLGNEEPSDLAALCDDCHGRIHNDDADALADLDEIAVRHPETFDVLYRVVHDRGTYL